MGEVTNITEMFVILISFLDGTEETLTLVTKLSGGITCTLMMDRENAKKQLDYLLTEWKRRQLERGNLYLRQQLGLLALIKERGLDPDNILGGFAVGLEESIPDLLKQTEKVVSALIEQINRDWGPGEGERVVVDG